MDLSASELFELISGENGFLVALRSENRFPVELYQGIIRRIRMLAGQWRERGAVPVGDFLAICYLAAETAGGNRFLPEAEAERLEDANLELFEILDQLEKPLSK